MEQQPTNRSSLALCKAQALYSYAAHDSSALEFAEGDYIDVISKLPSGWWNGWCNGRRGWFPATFVRLIEDHSNTKTIELSPLRKDSAYETETPQQPATLFDDGIRYNELTQRSSAEGTPLTKTPASSKRSSMIHATTSGLKEKRRSLPPNWVVQHEEDGSVGYYINTHTGEMRSSFPCDDSSSSIYDSQATEDEDEGDSLTLPKSHSGGPYHGYSNTLYHPNRHSHHSSSFSSVSSLVNTDNHGQHHTSKRGQQTTDQGLPLFHSLTTNEIAWQADFAENQLNAVNASNVAANTVTPNDNSSNSNSSNNSNCNSPNNAGSNNVEESNDTLSPMSTFSPVDLELRHQQQQQLSWSKLLTHITSVINQLTAAVKSSHSSLYKIYADRIVDAVRFMLFASGTINKESIHFRSNNVLRSHHRAMMASMTKVVITAEIFSNEKRLIQPSTNNYTTMPLTTATATELTTSTFASAASPDLSKLLQGCHELTSAVRNYISTCESIPVELHYVDPTFVLTGLNEEDDREWNHILQRRKDSISSGLSTISTVKTGTSINGFSSGIIHCPNNSSYDVGGLRAKYELEANLLENLEAYGASMQESMEPLMDNLTRQSDSRCSLAVLLFTHYRNFGNQNGQFLSIIEDIDFDDVLHLPAMRALNEAKQQLYDGLGLLFVKMQMMTDESVPLDQAIKDIQQVSSTIIDAIKSVCGRMIELVDDRIRILDRRTEQEQEQQQKKEQKQMVKDGNGVSAVSINSSDALSADKGETDGNADDTEDDANSFVNFLNDANSSLDPEFKLPPLLDKQQSYNAGKRSKSLTETQQNQDENRANPNSVSAPNSNRSSLSDVVQRRQYESATVSSKNTSAKLKQFFGDDLPSETSISLLATPKSVSPTTAETIDDTRRKLSMTPTSSDLKASGNAAGPKPKDAWYLQRDYEDEIVFSLEDGSVKGGTLRALVERMTLHDYLDTNFNSTFLLTYRSFCTSMDLLSLLMARYTIQAPEGLSPEELKIWSSRKQKIVRIRVFNVLKSWVEHYYYEEDSVLLDRLLFFTSTTICDTMSFTGQQLEALIHKRKDARADLKRLIVTQRQDLPEPIVPRDTRNLRLLDVDPLEMARQLTLLDFKLFSSIKPVECLDKAWSRDTSPISIVRNLLGSDSSISDGSSLNQESSKRLSDQQQRLSTSSHTVPSAVNIRSSIEYCNRLTTWVTDTILSQLEVKKRSLIIKYWVQVAERCRHFNNFNTCMAIISAFDNSSIGRLKRTWELVGARTNHVLSHIRKLMGADRNFNQYRVLIHSVNPPCIPFLGIYLQDLTFIEDGNPNYLKTSKDYINFAKRAKTAQVIKEIQQYQTTGYYLQNVLEIQKFIVTSLHSARDEEILYRESLKLEPKEREDEKITRLLQESGFL